MLSWDGRFLHLSDHLLRSWSFIPGKLHFDINIGLSLQFLYVISSSEAKFVVNERIERIAHFDTCTFILWNISQFSHFYLF